MNQHNLQLDYFAAIPRRWKEVSYLRTFLRLLPQSSRLSSLDIGFKCMKLQNPPRVHSLQNKEKNKMVNNNNKKIVKILFFKSCFNQIQEIIGVKVTQKMERSNSTISWKICIFNCNLSLPHFILSATSFSEVCDRGQFCMNWASIEPTIVQFIYCFFCIFLIAELKHENKSLNVCRAFSLEEQF